MTILAIAQTLNIDPKVLEKESTRVYLQKKLRSVEAELYALGVKYGIRNFDLFKKKIIEGHIHEEEKNWEDYFKFQNLDAKRKKMLKMIRKL